MGSTLSILSEKNAMHTTPRGIAMPKKLIRMIIMGILFCGYPVYGETQIQHYPKELAVVSSQEMERIVQVKEVHKMMGYINLAYLALDIDLPQDAISHIEKAEALADQVQANAPSLMTDFTLKYGKVSFTSQNLRKEYYVPVLDDLFLLSEYDTVYRHLQSIDLQQTDAGVVNFDMLIDLRKIVPALKAGKQDLTRKEYRKAQAIFAKIFHEAIVHETEITDPGLVIYDNLALVKNFIQNGLYPSARHTLRNVMKGLMQLEKQSLDPTQAQGVNRLSTGITQLDAELEKRDPAVMQRAGRQFLAWMKTVKSWY